MGRAAHTCFLLLALLASHVGATDLPEIERIGSVRVVVALDARRPEFFSLKPESPGFDRDILEGFSKLHRLKLEVVPVANWASLIPTLLDGKGDLIAGRFSAHESRRKVIDFTTEVFPRRLVVLTRKPHRVVKSREELRTERVGTVKGTGMAEAIAAAGVPPSLVDDGIGVGGDLPGALRSGRVTATVWGFESALAEQREDPDIQIGMFLGERESIAFGVRKEDKRLLAALNEYIDGIRRSGTWNRLVVKYFGDAALKILKTVRPE
jgi:ABC-type amino acid transport substrate-binding protein